MANIDDNEENEGNDDFEEKKPAKKIDKKKIVIILLPLLIVIALAVGFHHLFGLSSPKVSEGNYSVLEKPSADENDKTPRIVVFYDLPEVSAPVKVTGSEETNTVNIKLNIELSNVEDVKAIEALLPNINDIILNHTSELSSEEINGANGLYWLKEELLYRINLITAPVKVKNLNFKGFELQKRNN